MSDDRWGRDDRDPFDDLDDEFGEVRFADEPAPRRDSTTPDGTTAATSGLSSGAGDTGELPHWTEAPSQRGGRREESWGAFDDEDDPFLGEEPRATRGRSQYPGDDRDEYDDQYRGGYQDEYDESPTAGMQAPPRRGIGGGLGGRGSAPRGERPGSRPPRQPRRGRGRQEPSLDEPGGRDMPTAVGVGLGLAALFVLLDTVGSAWMVTILVSVVMAIGATEFFSKTSERGYHPVLATGITAIALGPIAAYNAGEAGLVLTLVLAFMGSSIVFMAADGVQSGPLPNMAMTTLGVVYLGRLGSFGGLVLSGGGYYGNVGTDTMFILVVGVVASDVAGLFIGQSIGRTPLRGWVSPGKTVEGLVGGWLATIIAVALISLQNDTWNGKGNVLLLGIGIGIFAPLGDLTESMFKRNLDIKDFGTLIKGHGGVLDRFDGFLFAAPFTYYMLIVLQPWG